MQPFPHPIYLVRCFFSFSPPLPPPFPSFSHFASTTLFKPSNNDTAQGSSTESPGCHPRNTPQTTCTQTQTNTQTLSNTETTRPQLPQRTIATSTSPEFRDAVGSNNNNDDDYDGMSQLTRNLGMASISSPSITNNYYTIYNTHNTYPSSASTNATHPHYSSYSSYSSSSSSSPTYNCTVLPSTQTSPRVTVPMHLRGQCQGVTQENRRCRRIDTTNMGTDSMPEFYCYYHNPRHAADLRCICKTRKNRRCAVVCSDSELRKPDGRAICNYHWRG